ncbi:MAG TPA: hypothetical protein VJZ71_20825 [Phycisphaerae bacterium]|nr:hypothetical protein [Phycisphaerae bacterium]
MNRKVQTCMFAALVIAVGGCELFFNLGQNRTSVRLVNNADFTVEVDLYISNEQDIPREVLTVLGDKLEFTLAPGESTSFMRDCDDLQAVVIDDANLRDSGFFEPDADTNVLRDDGDFDCGDTIVFTFDHSSAVTDFHINVEVIPGPP